MPTETQMKNPVLARAAGSLSRCRATRATRAALARPAPEGCRASLLRLATALLVLQRDQRVCEGVDEALQRLGSICLCLCIVLVARRNRKLLRPPRRGRTLGSKKERHGLSTSHPKSSEPRFQTDSRRCLSSQPRPIQQRCVVQNQL